MVADDECGAEIKHFIIRQCAEFFHGTLEQRAVFMVCPVKIFRFLQGKKQAHFLIAASFGDFLGNIFFHTDKTEMRIDGVFVPVGRLPNQQLAPARAGDNIVLVPRLFGFGQPVLQDVFIIIGISYPKQAVCKTAETVLPPIG